jgi:hypothetical protein
MSFTKDAIFLHPKKWEEVDSESGGSRFLRNVTPIYNATRYNNPEVQILYLHHRYDRNPSEEMSLNSRKSTPVHFILN